MLPADAAVGAWDVTVTNPDDESATLVGGFTIRMPPVTVLSITPNTGLRGSTVPVTIGGTEFAAGATVTLTKSGQPDIVATSVVVVSPATITCSLELPATAAPGAWNVVVAIPDGRSGTLVNGFTITLPPITGDLGGTRHRHPGHHRPGHHHRHAVRARRDHRPAHPRRGANHLRHGHRRRLPGADHLLVCPAGDRAPRSLQRGRDQPRPDHALPNGFTIEPPLAVLSIAPNTGVRGTTVPVAITGSPVRAGATVSLVRLNTLTIPGTGVVVKSPTQITCSFALPALTNTGAWNVVVTIPAT